jgi:hypothetical protein
LDILFDGQSQLATLDAFSFDVTRQLLNKIRTHEVESAPFVFRQTNSVAAIDLIPCELRSSARQGGWKWVAREVSGTMTSG